MSRKPSRRSRKKRSQSRVSGKTESSLTFKHHTEHQEMVNGKKVYTEELILDGPKGTSFKYFKKTDDKAEKYVGRRNEDGTFSFTVIKGDGKDTKDLSLTDLIKEIKKIKVLEFVVQYLSKSKQNRSQSRAKRRSKKVSKKGSRKGSKKGSRKGSKKASRKGSKKGSKKVSKKGSRRKSKKTPTKRKSRRKSRK